jgi:hypothetical protein
MPIPQGTSRVESPKNQAQIYRKSAARLQGLEALEREFEAFVRASKQTLALSRDLVKDQR